jgi:WD40 repeat protein
MAFNADVAGEKFRFFLINVLSDWFVDLSVGSNLYVIPLNDTGRKPKNYPLLHAHSDLVTDLDFSPFDDGLLATGSQDSMVTKLHFISIKLKVICLFWLRIDQIMEHSRVWIVRNIDDARVSVDSCSSASNRKRLVPSRRRFFAFHFVRKCHDLVGHSQATRAHE